MSVLLAIIIVLLSYALYLYKRKSIKNYWKNKGMICLDHSTFREYKSLGIMELSYRMHQEYKSRGLKHIGTYHFLTPVYQPVDLELIKCILMKDFEYFPNHGNYHNEETDPLSAHLFNLEGEKWKNMRIKLTPTFTSGKMKMMFQTLVECTTDLVSVLNENATSKNPVDIKEILACFTTDVIGSCAFGVNCNCMKNSDAEFRKQGIKIFESNPLQKFKHIISHFIPKWILTIINFKITTTEVEQFFLELTKSSIDYREKNHVYRKDFMQLMIELKNAEENTEGKNGLSINQIAAQCLLFFIAGFETSASTMTFALYELARNKDIQEKLRKEIQDTLAKYDGQITYDSIIEMNYLDKVVNESLRKHPATQILIRGCAKPYKVPDTNIIIEPGTRVFISTFGIHKDPEYYPDPEKFDPDRFNEENKSKRPPLAFLPFGEGPRNCIGLRFGKMQVKVGLSAILSNFSVTLNEQTPYPLEYEPDAFITKAKGTVWLNIEKLDNN